MAEKPTYEALEQELARLTEENCRLQKRNIISEKFFRKQRELRENRRQNNLRTEALLKLSQMQMVSFNEILDFTLEKAVEVTDSKIGYIFLYNETTRILTLYAWSDSVTRQCNVPGYKKEYSLPEVGWWGEAIRNRSPMILNDYNAPEPAKNGLPNGHVGLQNHLNVPLFQNGKIVALVGVSNKPADYTPNDIKHLNILMNYAWKAKLRQEIEDRLRISEGRLKMALEAANDGFWDWNVPQQTIYFSPRCYTMLGYEPYEFGSSFEAWLGLFHPEDRPKIEHQIEEVVDKHLETFNERFRIRNKQGHWCWILTRGKVMEITPQGFPLRVIGTHMDITHQTHIEINLQQQNAELQQKNIKIKQINEALEITKKAIFKQKDKLEKNYIEIKTINEHLKNSEAQLKKAQEIGQIGSWLQDLQTGEMIWSEQMFRNFGYPPNSIAPTLNLMLKHIDSEFHNQFLAMVNPQASRNFTNELTTHITTKKGERRVMNFSGQLLDNEKSKPDKIIWVCQDITELKHNEQKLKHREQELLQKNEEIFSQSEEIRVQNEEIKQQNEAAKLLNAELQKTNNRMMLINKNLKENEHKYRTLVENSSEGIAIVQNTTIVFVNKHIIQLLGFEEFELINQRFSRVLVKNEVHKLKQIETHFSQNQRASIIFNSVLKTKDNGTVAVELNVSRIKFENKKSYLIFIRDLTHLQQAQAERLRLETIIEQITEGVVITNTDGKLEYVNAAYQNISGYSKYELFKYGFQVLRSGHHSQQFYKTLWDTILNGQTWTGNFINRRKDGSFYEEHTVISPISNSQGQLINFVAVKRDVTDEVKREKQLQQSQKLQAIGTLASGIAHDFNNILMGMQIYTELAISSVAQDSITYKNLQKITTSQLRAKELVKQILSFSRSSDAEQQLLAVHTFVEEALAIIEMTFPSSITIVRDIRDSGMVKSSPSQIHQLIMNLCNNAKDAMQGSGTLTIGLKVVGMNEIEKNQQPISNQKKWVLLTVKDTGTGMTSQTKERIFEPFFTTKKVGSGTGLGMATVHNTVENSGGYIHIETEIGKGSTFYIYLPKQENSN